MGKFEVACRKMGCSDSERESYFERVKTFTRNGYEHWINTSWCNLKSDERRWFVEAWIGLPKKVEPIESRQAEPDNKRDSNTESYDGEQKIDEEPNGKLPDKKARYVDVNEEQGKKIEYDDGKS